MSGRKIVSVLVSGLVVLALAVPAAAWAGGASNGLAVNARAHARATCALIDDHTIELRSNVPWRLDLVTAEGVSDVRGPKAPEFVRVRLPEGVTSWSLAIDE